MVSFLVRPSSWTGTRLVRPSSWTGITRKSNKNKRSICTLASLVEQGKFEKLLKRLNEMDNERFLLELLVSTCNNDDDSLKDKEEEPHKKTKTCNTSLLHVALANRAPLSVVETLLSRINECYTEGLVPEEIQEDASGKTLLHVAAENGCDVNVMERLLNGETLIAPAYTKDKLGRFPLHWACCLPHETKERKMKQKKKATNAKEEHNINQNTVVCKEYYYNGKKEIRRETIHLLLHAYSVAAVIPDIYGMTPLDYARSIQLDPHTIHLLATVAKVHGDVRALARRRSGKACQQKFAVYNNNNNQRFDSPFLQRNSSETTERSIDEEDEDSPVVVGHDEKEKVEAYEAQDGASSSSSSLPEGTLSYGEILFEHSNDMDDDISSLGSSQENEETEESASTSLKEQPVATTYVRPCFKSAFYD
jgi:Ankyrin repeats (3 copies)